MLFQEFYKKHAMKNAVMFLVDEEIMDENAMALMDESGSSLRESEI